MITKQLLVIDGLITKDTLNNGNRFNARRNQFLKSNRHLRLSPIKPHKISMTYDISYYVRKDYLTSMELIIEFLQRMELVDKTALKTIVFKEQQVFYTKPKVSVLIYYPEPVFPSE